MTLKPISFLNKNITLGLLLLGMLNSCSNSEIKPAVSIDIAKEKSDIKQALFNQQSDWNKGDIPAFMEGYLKNDSLSFIGSKGITRGWQNTLDNYLKSYPDTTAMGQLEFEILELTRLSPEFYYMIGKFTLHRVSDQPYGYFNLIWKKIENKWVIISDHTSSS